MANKHDLLLLFERPTEPVFMMKGKNSSVFDVPVKFLSPRYRPLIQEITNIFGDNVRKRIPVRDILLPDLRICSSLGRHENFSLFIPRHRHMAGRLIDILMGAKTLDDLQSVAVYARDRVNPYLFNYALSVTLLNRADTKSLNLPTLAQVFPNMFVSGEVFQQLREEVSIVPEGSRMPILVPSDYTFSSSEPEHCLWYFREDLGINLHHWHWHLVYPHETNDPSMVRKDRRGELFYYMHHQIVARYNVERFCNNLSCVKSMSNLRAPIAKGYFPKMDSVMASRSWPARCDNITLSNVNRELDQIEICVADVETWRARLYEAINQGFALDENHQRIYLDEQHGIDVLGNMLEASILSPNREYYGQFHNKFHSLIAFCHDPQQLHLESFGIMGRSATAIRDPVFFELHAHIDDIFGEHKLRLPAYTQAQLQYEGIIITDIIVTEEKEETKGESNNLLTFWQQSDLDVSLGMDFMPRGSVFVRFTHLQHENFIYTLHVTNNSILPRLGTVRIFLAPKYDEKGKQLMLKEQRLLMLELDRFVISIKPGVNEIRRRSSDSSVTIPYERTFGNLNDTTPPSDPNNDKAESNFCMCGWPQHMLLPKGTTQGMIFQLFVMVSNYDDDRVEQQLFGTCSDASSFCGIRDRLYPDRRAMGFPFDRLPRKDVDYLQSFLTPNMFVADVIIQHEDRTILRPAQ